MKFERDVTKPWTFKEATKETPVPNPLPYSLIPAVLGGSVFITIVIPAGLFAAAVGWPVAVPLAIAGIPSVALTVLAAINIDLIPKIVEKIKGHKPPEPPQQQRQSPSLAITYHRSERHKRLDELPGPPEVIMAWAEVFIRGGSVAYKAWEAQFGYRIDENDKDVSLYREFRKRITSGDKPLAKEHGKHSIKPTRYGFEEFSDLVRVGLDNATPLLAHEAQGTENDRWEPPTHTDTPAGE